MFDSFHFRSGSLVRWLVDTKKPAGCRLQFFLTSNFLAITPSLFKDKGAIYIFHDFPIRHIGSM